MKIFLDTADLDEIRDAAQTGFVDGVTTNPSLLARARVVPGEFLAAVARLVPGPVSFPVRAVDADEIVREGRVLAAVHDRVAVKIPITVAGLQAIVRLHGEGVRTHATLCCTASQALLAARAGADFLSPLVGRLEDRGEPGLELVSQIVDIYDNYDYDTQIIAASIKKLQHVHEVARLGADGVTVPKALFDAMVRHPLTDSLQETFLADWKRL